MTNEKALTPDEKKMEIYLEEWETYNNQICDISEAIDHLTNYRTPYAISFLAADLVKLAEGRQEALDHLKQYGINTHEDAICEVCRRKPSTKATA